jgi:ribitol-5-phosphate 2-dehydrogenase
MINRIYRLMDTKRMEMVQREVCFPPDGILVRPEYMAICAADQRYYLGQRSKEVLQQKLPMALIHEATATVLYDFDNQLAAGSKVVLLPLEPAAGPPAIKENYRPESKFLSSDLDGFMQDIIALPRRSVIPITDDYSIVYVFSEIVSVALNAIEAFKRVCLGPPANFGVWGDGSMGYVISLILKCLYPDVDIYVFGKNTMKLRRFSFVKQAFVIGNVPCGLTVEHGFECVGSMESEAALQQIIELLSPQGCISLLGVSEDAVSINTRAILRKGLLLIGNNRSGTDDLQKAVKLIQTNELCRKYLRTLISEVIDIKSEDDIWQAFERDVLNDFKTVLRWKI